MYKYHCATCKFIQVYTDDIAKSRALEAFSAAHSFVHMNEFTRNATQAGMRIQVTECSSPEFSHGALTPEDRRRLRMVEAASEGTI